MGWWQRLRDRHDDGTEHIFEKVSDNPGWHSCSDYCHHYLVKCRLCQERRVLGYSTEEIR